MYATGLLVIVVLGLLGIALVSIYRKLLSIEQQLRFYQKLDKRRDDLMSKELDDLTTEVSETTVAIDAAVTLIEGIAARIAAAGVDPAKLQALTDELNTKSTALAEAVAANTPSDPNAPPAEPDL